MINIGINIILGNGPRGGGGGSTPYVFSDEYKAVQDYCDQEEIPLPELEIQKLEDTLIKGLVAEEAWEEYSAFWNHITIGTKEYALINKKNPGTSDATLHGTVSPSFVVREGFYGNAAQSAYINYNWTPSGDTVFTRNDAGLLVYTKTGEQSTTVILGTTNGSAIGRLFFNPRSETDAAQMYINTFGSVSFVRSSFEPGVFFGQRVVSTDEEIYLDGVHRATGNLDSNGVSDHSLVGFAFNNNGTISGHRNGNLGIVAVGSGQAAVDHEAVATLINNYITAIQNYL